MTTADRLSRSRNAFRAARPTSVSVELASNRTTVTTAAPPVCYHTGSYERADLRIDYAITRQLTVGVGARNLFDDYYVLTDASRNRAELLRERSGAVLKNHKRPFSGTLIFPESGRLFTAVGDADGGRSVAHGDARLLGSAYGHAATHNRFPA